MPIKIVPTPSKKGAMTTGKTKEQQKKDLERQQKMRGKSGETAPMEPISKRRGGGMSFRDTAKAVKENKSGSYKIKSGDSLSAIAKARGTTVKKLMEMNPSIKNANQIRAGASLKVPPKTEVSKMTGSKRSPYRGMTSKEITSGTMRKSGSKTSGAKSMGKAVSPKAGSAKPYAKPSGASSAKPKGRLLDRFMPGKAESRKKAREEIPVAAKKGGAMKKTKGYASGGKMPMVTKNGKKVPAFAADGKGKMMGGGMTKKTKGYAAGGVMKKTKGYSKGGVARGMGAATKGGKFTRGA
jgi:LysM repeat protein